jgi:branched-subunit amino acid ABC-type transport system permease component
VTDLLQILLDGVAVGASYGLLALGFTLIFGVLRRLNLAYGPSIMLGAYAGTFVACEWKLGGAAAAAATVAGAVAAGFYVERLCFAAMRRGAALASMVASFALWMQLEEVATLLLPRHTYPFPALWSGPPFELAGLYLRPEHLLMLVVAAAASALLAWIVRATRFGRQMRAVTEDPGAAALVGVDVARVTMLSFLLASALGGLAGLLIVSADAQVTPMLGMWATLKGLIAMMLGGLGSLPGAILGGLLLGVVEQGGQAAFGPQARDLIAFLLLFACLSLRPGGLLGQAAVREDVAVARG